MNPIKCDFSIMGTFDTGHSLLVCVRAGCGKTIKVKGERCNAICRVQPEEPERPTAETFACEHRGEKTKFSVGCGCGDRDSVLPVYSCDIHSYCTVASPGRHALVDSKKVACCVGCDSRQPLPAG